MPYPGQAALGRQETLCDRQATGAPEHSGSPRAPGHWGLSLCWSQACPPRSPNCPAGHQTPRRPAPLRQGLPRLPLATGWLGVTGLGGCVGPGARPLCPPSQLQALRGLRPWGLAYRGRGRGPRGRREREGSVSTLPIAERKAGRARRPPGSWPPPARAWPGVSLLCLPPLLPGPRLSAQMCTRLPPSRGRQEGPGPGLALKVGGRVELLPRSRGDLRD